MVRYSLSIFARGLFLVILASLVIFPGYASKHSVFDPEETAEIERIIRDYIRDNPEIIVDALRQLQDRQRVAEVAQSRKLIAQNREYLLSDPGSPVGGNPNGDITVVEFFDYRCPYCKTVAPRLSQLLKQDDNIRFVYKEWPILGPVSVVAARAALAAWKQGMYVEFHNRLMEASGQLNEEMVFDLAEEAGLDVDRMREEMDTPEITNILRRNSKLASALRITGTPAFVIGDVLVPGAVELTDLRALVEEAREGN